MASKAFQIAGTLEAIWRVREGVFGLQILGSYRRYNFVGSARVASALLDTAYIGDKVLLCVEGNEVIKGELFVPPLRIVRPEMEALSMLAEIGGIL